MAYTNTLLSKTPVKGTTNTRLAFAFTSDTPQTEPPFEAELILAPAMSLDDVSGWLWRQANEAKAQQNVLDALSVGQAVAMVAPAEEAVEP